MGVTDAFSMVFNPIQSPVCFSKDIFVTLAIPSIKTKMVSSMGAKSSINLIIQHYPVNIF